MISKISAIVNNYSLDDHLSKKKISAVKIIFGVCLLFFCSQVSIPLTPVPISMQTAGSLLIALTYRRFDALIAMSSFLALGAAGLPVFSDFSGGAHIFVGTTGGYLIGMLFSVYLVTSLRRKYGDDSFVKLGLYSLAGSIVVFMVGVPYLACLIGLDKAIELGFIPFIIPGTAKALFVASSVRIIKKNMSCKT